MVWTLILFITGQNKKTKRIMTPKNGNNTWH
jgi:hypothetical protein